MDSFHYNFVIMLKRSKSNEDEHCDPPLLPIEVERTSSGLSSLQGDEYIYEDEEEDDYDMSEGEGIAVPGDGTVPTGAASLTHGLGIVSETERGMGSETRLSVRDSAALEGGDFLEKMRVDKSGVRSVDFGQIEGILTALVVDVSALLNVSEDTARILLHYYKWNKERLVDSYYSDPDELLISLGATADPRETVATQGSSAVLICPICDEQMSDSDMCSLACGHFLCKVCWMAYLRGKVGEGPSCIKTTCPMFKCKLVVPASLFVELSGPEDRDKYRIFVARNFVETSKNFRWCPAAGCEK